MTDEIKFPTNPFEDIQPTDFNKLNKKHVTEDFVEENLRILAWEVYSPFNDTGIDRIIVKNVCKNGHTKVNENLFDKKCPVCNSESITITRFVQIKTRELKDYIFGFTLKPKDIRIDPRQVYFLYSDKTTETQQDFFILSVKDYLEFFIKANSNPFAPTSFRKGNNKLNSLKYNPSMNKWSWSGHSWESYRNIKGMIRIQSPIIDINLKNEIIATRKLADKLQRVFSRGRSYDLKTETKANQFLNKKTVLYGSKNEILKLRKRMNGFLEENCDKETYESSLKYFENIKIADILGGNDDED